jgi:hypothetical protein
LSVDAVHDAEIDVVVAPDFASPVGAVGAVVSGHAAAEAVIDARVELFPAASKACTPSVWLVPQTRPVNVKEVVVVVPAAMPSRKTVYPVTPTLSVEAAHEAGIVVVVAPEATRPVGTEGAVRSGQAAVVTFTVVRVELLPAASNAWTPSTWLAAQLKPVTVNDVVVVVPALTPSANTVYPVTPMLSVEAVHESAAELDVIPDAVTPVGADGTTVSGQGLVRAVTVVRVETLPAASKASTPRL